MDRIRTWLGRGKGPGARLFRLGPIPPLIILTALLAVVVVALGHRAQPVLAPAVPVHHAAGHARRVVPVHRAVAAPRTRVELAPRLPLAGPVRVGYGWMYDRSLGAWRFHPGWDILGVRGQPVVAAVAGTVTAIGSGTDGLATVTVDSGQGREERYVNLEGLEVRPGERVEPGTILGAVGSAGHGPAYLRFEVLAGGSPVSPATVVSVSNRGS